MAPLKTSLRALPVIALLLTLVGLSPAAKAAPGDLDPSFGTDGKLTTEFTGTTAGGSSVALQPDGKIVVAGLTGLTSFAARDFALTRYNPNGSLDASFGTGGILTTDFSGGSDGASSVALQPDGKIVAAGSTGPLNGAREFALARYNPDGTLDSSFGTGGKVVTNFPSDDEAAFAMALQPDGKIVAAGTAFTPSNLGDFIVARYNADGTPDLSFGTGGEVTTDFGQHDGAFAVVLQTDGKIVAAGFTGNGEDIDDFALARFNPDGGLDPSFGVAGKMTTDFAGGDDVATGAALQPDGKIVVVGGRIPPGTVTRDFALARYNPNGGLDQAFGTGGKVTTDFAGNYDLADAVSLQTDGKIVTAGLSGVFIGDLFDFALARYNSDGSLDASFGTGGKITTDFAGGTDEISGVALQPDGKIVAAGVAAVGSSLDFGLARYEWAAITVPIDIKPGSTTNPIKVSSTGRIPVAILSTRSFDATTIDPTSVCFGDADVPGQRACTATHSSLEDVNADGRPDLLLLFATNQTGIDPGDTQACLSGRMFSGLGVEGCDSIRTL